MKTILILGGTGMLGSAVGQYLQAREEKYSTFLTARDISLAYGKRGHWIKFDPTGKTQDAESHIEAVLERMPRNPDCIINCIGTIKPFMSKNKIDSIYINSLFPHQLSETCKALGIRVINITTDCCFSGSKGSYRESSPHDAIDDYGKSKSLGEATSNSMCIRTSIIGPELHKQASLIAWAKAQAGKSVSGYRNHRWNGITCKQYADVCAQIINKDLYDEGLFHVHSDTVTKYQLLRLISERYELNLDISEIDAPEAIDRSLATEKPLMSKLSIPSLREQIMNL